MEARDLKRLVRAAARGDRGAAGELFDTYQPRLYRYALGRLGSGSDAEDVAAETFARVLGKLDGFRWKGAGFEAWLFRIASNLVVDKTRITTRERPTDEELDTRDMAMDRMPEDRALYLETRRELSSLLVGLPDDQREVLLLRFAAGLDTNETGAVMGRKANAVRQLQFRALENLRSMAGVEAMSP